MAGHKSLKGKDAETKKRKRDTAEGDIKSKRHRLQHGDKVNGHSGRTGSKNGTVLKVADQSKITAVQGKPGYRPHQVVRQTDSDEPGWKISQPMGGRMLNVDPILTRDEQHLILTYNTSIQVYTAADSLLLRRIPISTLDATAPKGSKPAVIVATRLSAKDSEYVWIACSDGSIYHINWVEPDHTPKTFKTNSGTAQAMTVVSSKFADKDEDMVLVIESDKANKPEVVAYQGTAHSPSSKILLTLKMQGDGLQLLEASNDGQYIVGALHDRLFIGTATHRHEGKFDDINYEFNSFEAPDLISALDLRVYPRIPSAVNSGKKVRSDPGNVLDILAGGARGSIYLYHDVLAQNPVAGRSTIVRESIQAKKFHWHRKAVHAVKWSPDGNYIISGGSENVIVLWQVDTMRKDFLPHLSGSVENIVVSLTGSSYVVHLDDNSAMILSTSEMKPTAYVSGIQSATIDAATPKDMLVKRAWTVAEQVRRPIPAAIRSTDPTKLHVCVGNGRQATMSGDFSAPLLQSFDLETFTNSSKQALARTQTTDLNLSKRGYPIDEPAVTHIAFSGDGKWLASVDDWVPSARDVEHVSQNLREQFIRERHEVYLKFWQVGDVDEPIALVSRINSPHVTSEPETVLDLASDSMTTCFATIGSDGIVRLWRPKTRQQDGLAVKGQGGQDAVSWSCSQVIAVGEGLGQQAVSDLSNAANSRVKAQGSVTFSEDGSTIFAAFGAVDAGAVYVIDTASGQIVRTLEGLWSGQLQSIKTLSHFVIVLSDDLRVYDVVSDELRYGIVVPKIPGVNELLQLAVDHSSGRFAITLPIGDFSSIGVFNPEEPEPLLVRSTPHRVVGLISVPNANGFIALDDVAQVWIVSEGSDPSPIAISQPLRDMQLDNIAEEEAVALAAGDEDKASDDEMEEDEEDEAEESSDVDMDDDDFYPSVVAQQHLAEIFDAAPAFAAPSVEDMFYKVTGLLATKPLSAAKA